MNLSDRETPIIAPAAAGPERRTGKRHSLVLLVGKVLDPAGAHACLVHDVSPTGLMARFIKLPVAGQRTCIEIRGLPPIDAIVRWVEGFKAGIEFDTRQDVECVFKVKRDDGLVARAPRFPISAPAQLRIGAQRIKAEALDISPGGTKLTANIGVQRGQTGQVLLTETGTALFGTICWAYDGRLGFKFVVPMPLATLSAILANQQTHRAAAE
ncbi:PilZ domain-containing protein [Sphingomonas bacterium]|uniref:PilZ domain-containing protein n=1 Tax=Sphingomonas bacterium TaxID=1895847 RepID=UPI0015752F09|nr:PilZ domain-containing protein [Sphingomonas bacterium]